MAKRWTILALGLGLACQLITAGDLEAQEYNNDFQQAEIGKIPDDFLVLEGGFNVQEDAGNKFLELPGAPLDTFGVLYGPAHGPGIAVSGRIYGTGKGRRYPAFSVGLNGQGEGSYRLQVTPAKKSLELYRGEIVVTNTAFAWTSGAWTQMRLQVRGVKDGQWLVEGKAWKEGDPEPSAWQIVHTADSEPPKGRASIWGNPFSGTPIRYDDLKVRPAK